MYRIQHVHDEGYFLVCGNCGYSVRIPANGMHGRGVTVADLRHMCPVDPA